MKTHANDYAASGPHGVQYYTPLTEDQLAELLGMTKRQMLRGGYDLDLVDAARWLIENKVDLDNRDAIVAMAQPGAAALYPPGFLDAAVTVARNLTLTRF